MEMGRELKRKVLTELIRLKQEKLSELKNAQRKSLKDIDSTDIDYEDPVESTKEQLVDEIGQTSSSLDFLAAEIETLKTIAPDQSMTAVTLGALIYTNAGYFLIGAANESFTLDGKKITGVSVNSPLYKKMEGLKKKAAFHLGNVEYVILDIY
jgi:hypothetical protein